MVNAVKFISYNCEECGSEYTWEDEAEECCSLNLNKEKEK